MHTTRSIFTSRLKTGLNSRVTAVMGSQWGDEGKGKLADVLAKNYDIVGRFNGGANAGHTVVANNKKYSFHILPCGLIYPHTQNILGNGTVIHIPQLYNELKPLDEDGIEWRGRLKISDRAHILFDFHQIIDCILENRHTNKGGIGTTKKGIGPAYSSKANRISLRFGMLRDWNSFVKYLRSTIETHQLMYDFEYDVQEEIYKYETFRDQLLSDEMGGGIGSGGCIIDGVQYVNQKYNEGKNIITEGANAAMLDIDYGTYPFVTSSSTTAGGISTGMGLSPDKIDCVIGVVKAYTTRVGSGPFPTELTDYLCGGDIPPSDTGTDIGRHLQNVGCEIGVTTKRKRRCGWIDIPLLQYTNMLNNYNSLNMTKLDVLDDLDEVRIGVAYIINGQRLLPGQMPSTLEELASVEVEYETMPGWKQSIKECKTFNDLPTAAKSYVSRVEDLVGCPVTWIGTGIGREDMVTKGFSYEKSF